MDIWEDDTGKHLRLYDASGANFIRIPFKSYEEVKEEKDEEQRLLRESSSLKI